MDRRQRDTRDHARFCSLPLALLLSCERLLLLSRGNEFAEEERKRVPPANCLQKIAERENAVSVTDRGNSPADTQTLVFHSHRNIEGLKGASIDT